MQTFLNIWFWISLLSIEGLAITSVVFKVIDKKPTIIHIKIMVGIIVSFILWAFCTPTINHTQTKLIIVIVIVLMLTGVVGAILTPNSTKYSDDEPEFPTYQDKANQTYENKLKRLKETCTKQYESNTMRKRQITQFNNLIRKLLSENRITKSEVNEFIKSKKEYKNDRKTL